MQHRMIPRAQHIFIREVRQSAIREGIMVLVLLLPGRGNQQPVEADFNRRFFTAKQTLFPLLPWNKIYQPRVTSPLFFPS